MSDAPLPRRVTEPGLITMPAETYHQDPCADPSMAASTAEDIMQRSARHAWANHPRLCPRAAEEQDPARWSAEQRNRMDFGSALHTLVLGAGKPIALIDAEDWRTSKAKEQRADAYAAGQVPILTRDEMRLRECADAARQQIAGHKELRRWLEAPGRAEIAGFWREPVESARKVRRKHPERWCRFLTDWMPDDPTGPLIDFKFTSADAAPENYSRQVRDTMGLRSAHYLRGSARLRGATPRGYWIVAVETNRPHGLAVYNASQALATMSREQWEMALHRWHECMAAGDHPDNWPSYAPVINEVEPASWQLSMWELAKAEAEFAPQPKKRIGKRRFPRLAMREAPAAGDTIQ